LRCAWPSDRKGSHRVKDCIRPAKLDKGTASFLKAKEYQKMKIAAVNLPSENSEDSEISEGSISTESSDVSTSDCPDVSSEELNQETQEARNWWDSPGGSD